MTVGIDEDFIALQHAVEHLEWCGYGCSHEHKRDFPDLHRPARCLLCNTLNPPGRVMIRDERDAWIARICSNHSLWEIDQRSQGTIAVTLRLVPRDGDPKLKHFPEQELNPWQTPRIGDICVTNHGLTRTVIGRQRITKLVPIENPNGSRVVYTVRNGMGKLTSPRTCFVDTWTRWCQAEVTRGAQYYRATPSNYHTPEGASRNGTP